MLMFIIGFVVAWILLGIFFYIREGKGGWSIWDKKWDTILMVLPAFPIIVIIESIEELRH